ncbi:MAG: TRAP transporter substrate-binding protein [Candidatus Asgardarchaeum sp.]
MKKNLILVTICLVLILTITEFTFAQEMTFKISDVNNPKDLVSLGAFYIRDRINELSNGRIVPKVYPNGVLSGGKGQAEIEMCQQGTIEMEITTTAYLGNLENTMSIFSLPFMFKDTDQLTAFVKSDSSVVNRISQKLEKYGLKVLGYWPRGFRQLSNSKRPVKKLEDLKGLKIRVMNDPLYVDTINTLGACAVPMAYGELYTALQLKTVDGQENAEVTMYTKGLYEVQKYLTVWDYSVDLEAVLVNLDWWKNLSKEDQSIIQQAVNESIGYEAKLVKESVIDYRKKVEESGTEVNILNIEEKAKLREAVKPVWEKYREVFGSDLLDEFIETVSEY